jgi:hypothetical protein
MDASGPPRCAIIRREIAMTNLSRHARVPMLLVMTVMAATTAGAGQAPAPTPAPTPATAPAARAPLPDMQRVAAALGVTCGYCHLGRGGSTDPAVTVSGKPRLAVAREMIDMTAALNTSVQAATGKPANETVAVQCVTCHRGVAIPRPLTDILLQTALRQGPEAAVTQYRELRERHYGRGAYDFGEETIPQRGAPPLRRAARGGHYSGAAQPRVLPEVGEQSWWRWPLRRAATAKKRPSPH